MAKKTIQQINEEKNFFRAPNDIFDLPEMDDLDSIEKLIYLYLCRCGNNAEAFPSYSTIAKKCGISKPTAIHKVNRLIQRGMIEKTVSKRSKGNNNPNKYRIFLPLEVVKESNQVVKGDDHPSKRDLPYKDPSYKEQIYIKNLIDYKVAQPLPHFLALSVENYHCVPENSFNNPLTSAEEILPNYNFGFLQKVNAIVGYYCTRYSKLMDKRHPEITNKTQLKTIYNSIYYLFINYPISEETAKFIVDRFYWLGMSGNIETDFNINHFAKGSHFLENGFKEIVLSKSMWAQIKKYEKEIAIKKCLEYGLNHEEAEEIWNRTTRSLKGTIEYLQSVVNPDYYED